MRRPHPAALLLLPLLLANGPCGPVAGGPLDGPVHSEVVTDWRFTEPLSTIEVETKPNAPLSVTTWCVTDGPTLYVPSRNAANKPWVQNVVADPRVRLRIDGQIYAGTLARVSDPEEQRRVVALLRDKYTLAGWGMDADPAASPGTWYFRFAAE